jgi:hypothetical protein
MQRKPAPVDQWCRIAKVLLTEDGVMTEDKARHYAKVLAEGMGITFYVVRSRERGFVPVQIPSDDCEILATINPLGSVNAPHSRPTSLGALL